jgi:ATP-binding cassette subfamily A (ABC1) protein 3
MNYSISVTTLEEVFLRVARGDEELFDAHRKNSADMEELVKPVTNEHSHENGSPSAIKSNGSDNEEQEPLDKDFNIAEDRDVQCQFFKHFWALFVKRAIYFKRDIKAMIFEILLPIILVVLGLVM